RPAWPSSPRRWARRPRSTIVWAAPTMVSGNRARWAAAVSRSSWAIATWARARLQANHQLSSAGPGLAASARSKRSAPPASSPAIHRSQPARYSCSVTSLTPCTVGTTRPLLNPRRQRSRPGPNPPRVRGSGTGGLEVLVVVAGEGLVDALLGLRERLRRGG